MWMQRPAVINCPPGLEYLTQIDQLLIKQVIDAIESEKTIPFSLFHNRRHTLFSVFFLILKIIIHGMIS